MRDDFRPQTKLLLAQRAGMRCSNPACRRSTCGPGAEPTLAVSVGVAAHISGAAPGGPRYDPNLITEERAGIGNGIWLCQFCARLVDVDIAAHPIALLHFWKVSAEGEAADALRSPARQRDNEPYGRIAYVGMDPRSPHWRETENLPGTSPLTIQCERYFFLHTFASDAHPVLDMTFIAPAHAGCVVGAVGVRVLQVGHVSYAYGFAASTRVPVDDTITLEVPDLRSSLALCPGSRLPATTLDEGFAVSLQAPFLVEPGAPLRLRLILKDYIEHMPNYAAIQPFVRVERSRVFGSLLGIFSL